MGAFFVVPARHLSRSNYTNHESRSVCPPVLPSARPCHATRVPTARRPHANLLPPFIRSRRPLAALCCCRIITFGNGISHYDHGGTSSSHSGRGPSYTVRVPHKGRAPPSCRQVTFAGMCQISTELPLPPTRSISGMNFLVIFPIGSRCGGARRSGGGWPERGLRRTLHHAPPRPAR